MNGSLVPFTIFFGGGLGALLRFWLGNTVMRRFGTMFSGAYPHSFPWGTLLVNLLGALAIAIIASLLGTRIDAPEWVRTLLITGFLGGFTTFSAFSLESAMLWQRGDALLFLCYVTASVAGCIGIVLIVTRALRLA